jgi:AraC-like DNA-binding protein
MADGSGVSVMSNETDAHSWALISRAPDARLKPYVIDYQGYKEHAQAALRRLQAPFAGFPMIVSLGPSIDILNGDRPREKETYRSFLAGLHDVHVFTEFLGKQRGFQVNFTLLGAYRFLNATMSDIANRCLHLGDLLGEAEAERLADALDGAEDWPARFDLMDAFLLTRMSKSRPMAPDVAWALKALQESGGARTIGALSRDLSCSRKTLIQRFHAQVGLSPKQVANILRFETAVKGITAATDEESWADLAIACGYYDQSHFNREFRRYSGRTPSEFRAALVPGGAGVLG